LQTYVVPLSGGGGVVTSNPQGVAGSLRGFLRLGPPLGRLASACWRGQDRLQQYAAVVEAAGPGSSLPGA